MPARPLLTCGVRPGCDSIIVAILSSIGMARRNLTILALAALSMFYWLFWLNIPLIGYSWFFVWHFVDEVVDQTNDFPAGQRAMPPSTFSDASGRALGAPFEATVTVGLLSWFVGVFGFCCQTSRHVFRLRNDPAYRALATAQNTPRAQTAHAPPVRRLERLQNSAASMV